VINRIDQCFGGLKAQSRQALIPFITVGDPHPGWTAHIMHELVSAGADIVELGVPFSDPMADGPVIQEASERAIARGVSLQGVLQTVGEFRRRDQHTPVVLMGYMNPLERYGHDAFARDAAKAGVDGVLMVDCPPEEMGQLAFTLLASGVYPIYLVAPTTTPERMQVIAQNAHGYLYYVSFKGITGANRLDHAGIAAPLQEIRLHTRLPVAVGFGIKDAAAAAAVARFADAVVIGSALVQALATAISAGEAGQRAQDFLAPVRKAMDNGRAFDGAGTVNT
jgi:tryptophan synthase alpha chain